MREAEVLPVQGDEHGVSEHGASEHGASEHGASEHGPSRKPGRPRSERAERAILDAALELFTESGVAGVCMEAVAARAGVGKATIYRRWPGKEDLLLDALSSLKSPMPEPRGESVREDLVAMLKVMCQDASDPTRMRRYSLLLGEGKNYPKAMARYKETVVDPRRELMRSVLRRGIATGELRPDLDVEVALFTLIGAVHAPGKDPETHTPEFAERIVDQAIKGMAPCPPPASPPA
jgi:AcrR family transcriptional regulator